MIGEKGRDAFYKGEIADKIDAFMQANGGFLRKADFEKHTSTWVDPVSVNYRGYDVFELPPNGQGIATLQILNILEGFDLRAMGRNSPETLHAMIEAKKIAWADRAKFYADPAFAKIPLAGLLSKSYAAERRKLIDPNHAAKQVEAGNPALEQGDTIYMCTADDEGNMVSLIQSNYRGMGSGIVVPGLGFMFQDRGELFSMEPQHANVYAPGKRPFHTIIPGFVMKDGKPWEAFGVMGGGMQPQGHVQVLTNQIDFGLNVQEAGDASRWQHEGDNEPTGEKMNASAGTLKWKAVFRTRRCASCARKVTTCVSTSAATAVIRRSKSKCMMAGAFTSAPANHAKTEWQLDTECRATIASQERQRTQSHHREFALCPLWTCASNSSVP